MELANMNAGIKQMQEYLDGADRSLQVSFEKMHQGYPDKVLMRFLKAREGVISKANAMLMDCLTWRLQNDIDNILSMSGDATLQLFRPLYRVKPIEPKALYDIIRETQLIGMSGYCRKGRPVFAIGVGLSGYDKAAVDKYVQSHIQINEYRDRVILPQVTKQQGHYVGSCIKILDMSGLRLSALSRLKILTAISTIDDLNYPEKTDTYYIVNAPYVFTSCWKAVKPLLQERTRRKVQVLKGCGKEELLQVMELDAIPHFAKSSSGSTKDLGALTDRSLDCFSSRHKFHVELWNYMKSQFSLAARSRPIMSQGSFHVAVPEANLKDGSAEVLQLIESTVERLVLQNGNDKDKLLNGLDDSASSKAIVEQMINGLK